MDLWSAINSFCTSQRFLFQSKKKFKFLLKKFLFLSFYGVEEVFFSSFETKEAQFQQPDLNISFQGAATMHRAARIGLCLISFFLVQIECFSN